MVASVLSLEVAVGDQIEAGATVLMLESMKMHIPVLAEHGGTVSEVRVAPGEVIQEGDLLVLIDRA